MEPPFAGHVVQAVRENFIASTALPSSGPLQQHGDCGKLRTLSADEFSAFLLLSLQPLSVAEVRTFVLSFDLAAALDTMRIVGLSEREAAPIIVTAVCPAGEGKKKKKKKEKEPDLGDFLSDMAAMDDQEPTPMRQHADFDLEKELTSLLEAEEAAYSDLMKDLTKDIEDVCSDDEEDTDMDLDEEGNGMCSDDEEKDTGGDVDVAIGVDSGADAALSPLEIKLAELGWTAAETGTKTVYSTAVGGNKRATLHSLNGIKATCHQHKDCVCWLSVSAVARFPLANARLDLVAWASKGSAMSADEHFKNGQLLKRDYGMKVKI